jgi:GT2 family glycosyltransferase
MTAIQNQERRPAEDNQLPAVDVVILSFERAQDTIAAIGSALEQHGVRVTVLVVDQGSSIGTLRKLRAAFRRDARVRLHELGYNAGCAGGRNIGTRLATAEIVVGLDNDATFESPEALKTVCARFAADPSLGALGFRILNASTNELDLLTWGYPRAQLPMAHRPFYTARFVGAGHAYRKVAFDAAGGYDETLFIYMEEPDLCFRLVNLGYRILYEPAVTILHKISPEQRVDWSENRYYLFTRNRLYTEYKNRRAPFKKILPMAVGYLIRGAINRLLGQAIRGALDAIPMCLEIRRKHGRNPPALTPFAEHYLNDSEKLYNGTVWQQLRRDVLIRLQSDGVGQSAAAPEHETTPTSPGSLHRQVPAVHRIASRKAR